MEKKLSNYSISELLSEDPNKLLDLFRTEYNFIIPEVFENVEDLKDAGKMMGRLANAYSYMVQLSAYAKISVRTAKKNKKSKDEIDDAVDRKAVIDTFVETLSMQYKAISRILTIKQQINEELRMTDGR